MELKSPLTFDEQVVKLKKNGMQVYSSGEAICFLKQVNYYRFTGYALSNRIEPHQSQYSAETTFEQVRKCYYFDVEMRHILRKYIEYMEIYYRSQIANAFSLRKCEISPHNQHYDRNNYYKKEDFDRLLSRILMEENFYKDSLVITHHKHKYGNEMPLWVLVEIMTLSTLSKYYGCMYKSDQAAIAEIIGTSDSILRNHLHCLSILRNICAHAGRLYGRPLHLPVKFGRNFLQKHQEIKTNTLFAYIIMIMRDMPNLTYKKLLAEDIIALIEKYKNDISFTEIGFPDSYEFYLRTAIGRMK